MRPSDSTSPGPPKMCAQQEPNGCAQERSWICDNDDNGHADGNCDSGGKDVRRKCFVLCFFAAFTDSVFIWTSLPEAVSYQPVTTFVIIPDWMVLYTLQYMEPSPFCANLYMRSIGHLFKTIFFCFGRITNVKTSPLRF